MNCQEFENNIDSLARDAGHGRGADEGARAEMFEHEASCADCAARLADERALTSALRALASSMKASEAPARTEAALLSSFRANTASAAVTEDESKAVRASNVLVMPERASVKAWSWAKSLAVASLAAAAAVALFLLAPQFVSSKKTGDVAKTQPETGPQKAEPQNKLTRSEDANASDPATGGDQLAATHDGDPQQQPTIQEDEDPTPRLSPSLATPRRLTSPARPSDVALKNNVGSTSARPDSEMAGDADAAEIATDFIPLTQGGQFGQAEGGHLVRVELPRSAMASFGLPVNYERQGGRVKADVLLGDDGVARAIRFVR
jgi:hypothetical protein